MLDPRGNTRVYLLCMYARVLPILQKGNYETEAFSALTYDAKFTILNKSKMELAIFLLLVLQKLALDLVDLELNHATNQLYLISQKTG